MELNTHLGISQDKIPNAVMLIFNLRHKVNAESFVRKMHVRIFLCGPILRTFDVTAFDDSIQHDNSLRHLFPNHDPKMGDSVGKRSLSQNVGTFGFVDRHDIGIDVVIRKGTF